MKHGDGTMGTRNKWDVDNLFRQSCQNKKKNVEKIHLNKPVGRRWLVDDVKQKPYIFGQEGRNYVQDNRKNKKTI